MRKSLLHNSVVKLTARRRHFAARRSDDVYTLLPQPLNEGVCRAGAVDNYRPDMLTARDIGYSVHYPADAGAVLDDFHMPAPILTLASNGDRCLGAIRRNIDRQNDACVGLAKLVGT